MKRDPPFASNDLQNISKSTEFVTFIFIEGPFVLQFLIPKETFSGTIYKLCNNRVEAAPLRKREGVQGFPSLLVHYVKLPQF